MRKRTFGLAVALVLSPLASAQGHEHGKPSPGQHNHEQRNHGQHNHGAGSLMKGAFGASSMSQEGSGTAWLPASSPMFMRHLPKLGRYDLSLMGIASLNYTDAGGRRGESQFFSNSMIMLMAQRETGGATFGLRGMLSLDPVFNGKRGYPNLFQTGETANGRPLRDRQHPHDLISELAFTYSRPLSDDVSGFLYAGLVGEPALGNAMYLHRPSGLENPEAPISHHWFDSTHISYGVLTGGLTFGDRWKVEASAFNGHEPDEDRYDLDPIRLNSASARLTYNPTRDLSFSAAYGFLEEPEALEPGVDQHRITASAHLSRPLGTNGDNLSLSFLYGRNIKEGHGHDAFNLEGTLYRGRTSLFARYENVEKDELVDVPEGNYRIHKLTFGGVHNFASRGGFDFGLGAYAGLYAFPSELEPYYGKAPVTLGVFVRIRPSAMNHDKH